VAFKFEQLEQRLMRSPKSHWVGLNFDKSAQLLIAVFVGTEENSELMPWHAMVTKGPWDISDDGEEFFLEALCIDNLLERLAKFIKVEHFVFFEVPNSIEMDVICKYPDKMFLTLFSELSEDDENIKESAIHLLSLLKENAK